MSKSRFFVYGTQQEEQPGSNKHGMYRELVGHGTEWWRDQMWPQHYGKGETSTENSK